MVKKFHLVQTLLLFSIVVLISSCMYSKKTTKKLLTKAESKTYDLLIVQGYPPDENGKWTRISKGRIYWAKYLMDQGIVRNVMFSGSAVYSPYYEAKVMAMYAIAIGIPADKVYTELKAEHSTENIYYSYKKGRQLGFKTFAVGTDPFQGKLTRRFTRKKVSPDIDVIPFVTDTLKVLEPTMTDPEIDIEKARKEDFVSIKKRQSFWRRWRGTLGKELDKTAYE